MAVERVIAAIADNESQLNSENSDRYKGKIIVPKLSGDYSVKIYAYDDAGNVSIATSATNPELSIEVLKWHTPKTNWTAKDRFNFTDYNRIKNNLTYLQEYAANIIKSFAIKDMGDDIESYTVQWDVDIFNLFETNLAEIDKKLFAREYGAPQTFYENGVFIQWNELNRLENAILGIKMDLDNYKAGLRRLSFRLGNFKGVSV